MRNIAFELMKRPKILVKLSSTLLLAVLIFMAMPKADIHRQESDVQVQDKLNRILESTASLFLQLNTTTEKPSAPTVASIGPFDYAIADAMLDYVTSIYKSDYTRVKELAVLMRIITRIRLEFQLWTSSGKHQDPLVFGVHTKFVERLHKVELQLYPFLNGAHNTVEQWMASYSGRGIVMSIASKHLRYVMFLLKNLKAVGCNLPIELVTEDANKLSGEHKALLQDMGAKIIHLPDVMENSEAHFSGYGMKLAALFVSSFREAIMIDCDDVFLRNPMQLLDDDGYKASGTLLFPDQHDIVDFRKRDWMLANMPKPIGKRVQSSRTMKGRARDIDTSVLVMDKVRSFYALLAAARLNMRKESETLYTIFWGDAELTWLAFEMAGVPYAISPYPAGGIGPLKGNEVCGKNMHVGNDGRPFYWNQGLLTQKDVNSNELLDFEAYVKVGVISFLSSPYCVKGYNPIKLNLTELKLIEELKNMWLETTGFSVW